MNLHDLLVALAEGGYRVKPNDSALTVGIIHLQGGIGYIDRISGDSVRVQLFAPLDGVDRDFYTIDGVMDTLNRLTKPEPREYIDLGEVAQGVWNKAQQDLYEYEQ